MKIMANSELEHLIAGYPVTPNLRHLANTVTEKKKDIKLREKKFTYLCLQEKFLSVKKSSWNAFHGDKVISRRKALRSIVSKAEFTSTPGLPSVVAQQQQQAENCSDYLVNVISMKELLFLRHAHWLLLKFLRHGFRNHQLQSVPVAANHALKEVVRILSQVFSRCKQLFFSIVLRPFVQKLVISINDVQMIKELESNASASASKSPILYITRSKSYCHQLLLLRLAFQWTNLKTPLVTSHQDFFANHAYMAFLEEFSDIIVVPVCVCSEELLSEGKMENKLLAEYTQQGEAGSAVRNFVHKFAFSFGFLGQVKISFSQPFYLKEMMSSCCLEKNDGAEAEAVLLNEVFRYTSESELLMATHLVSYLLVYKFAASHGRVQLSELVKEVEQLIAELNDKGARFGFTGSSESVVKHSFRMLRSLIRVKKLQKLTIIEPVTTTSLQATLQLTQLSRSVLRYFLFDAMILTAVSLLLENGGGGCSVKNGASTFTFHYNELMAKVEHLYRATLKDEFFLHTTERSVSSGIHEAFEKFVDNELFVKEENFLIDEEKWGHRYAKHLEGFDDSSEEDEENAVAAITIFAANNSDRVYSVNLNCSNCEKIIFYKGLLLKRIIEMHVACAERLSSFIGKPPIIKCELARQLFFELCTRAHNADVELPTTSVASVCNSLRHFQKCNILKCYTINGLELCYVSKKYTRDVIKDNIKKYIVG